MESYISSRTNSTDLQSTRADRTAFKAANVPGHFCRGALPSDEIRRPSMGIGSNPRISLLHTAPWRAGGSSRGMAGMPHGPPGTGTRPRSPRPTRASSSSINNFPTELETMTLLQQIHHGKQPAPRRVMLYGTHGIGKSTWGASADRPVFIQTEDGLGEIDCARFPPADSYEQVIAALNRRAG